MSIIAEKISTKTNLGRVRGIRLVWVPAHEVGMVTSNGRAVLLLLLKTPEPEGKRWIGTRPQAPCWTWEPAASYTTEPRARHAANRLWQIHEL